MNPKLQGHLSPHWAVKAGGLPSVHPQHLTLRGRELTPPISLHGSLGFCPHSKGVSHSLTAQGPRKCQGRGGMCPSPNVCLTGSQLQEALRRLWGGLHPLPFLQQLRDQLCPCPAPGGPPTWDIKVSHAEENPTPTETPQTLTNWGHTQEKT